MKIIIAVDGSEFSKKAIEESCQLFAGFPNLEMKVISVFKKLNSISILPFSIPENYQQEFDRTAQEDAEQITEEARNIIRKKCPNVDLTTEVNELIDGTISQKIIERSREWKADFIVVGTHGCGFWGRLTIGSVSDEVIHHAPCSVLVVRSQGETKAAKA